MPRIRRFLSLSPVAIFSAVRHGFVVTRLLYFRSIRAEPFLRFGSSSVVPFSSLFWSEHEAYDLGLIRPSRPLVSAVSGPRRRCAGSDHECYQRRREGRAGRGDSRRGGERRARAFRYHLRGRHVDRRPLRDPGHAHRRAVQDHRSAVGLPRRGTEGDHADARRRAGREFQPGGGHCCRDGDRHGRDEPGVQLRTNGSVYFCDA